MLSTELQSLQSRLQHQFKDSALLQRAVTHRSFSADHNERLEFLGDSVLSLAVSTMLYQRLRDLPEGDLSRMRANLVKQDSLHRIATRLKLSDVLSLGEGESKSGGKLRPSILADAVEALIGAVYLDAGFETAQAMVDRFFEGVDLSPEKQAAAKDSKTALQEWLQGRKMHLPQYRVVGTAGAAHNQTFDVECQIVELGLIEHGKGGSRRAAEQAAAGALFAKLKAKHA